jgi:hypothetical protein
MRRSPRSSSYRSGMAEKLCSGEDVADDDESSCCWTISIRQQRALCISLSLWARDRHSEPGRAGSRCMLGLGLGGRSGRRRVVGLLEACSLPTKQKARAFCLRRPCAHTGVAWRGVDGRICSSPHCIPHPCEVACYSSAGAATKQKRPPPPRQNKNAWTDFFIIFSFAQILLTSPHHFETKFKVGPNFNIFMKQHIRCFINTYFEFPHKFKDKLPVIITGYIKKNSSFYLLSTSSLRCVAQAQSRCCVNAGPWCGDGNKGSLVTPDE